MPESTATKAASYTTSWDTILAELKAANGFNRRGIVEKAGWATPLGSEQPVRALALACEQALGSS